MSAGRFPAAVTRAPYHSLMRVSCLTRPIVIPPTAYLERHARIVLGKPTVRGFIARKEREACEKIAGGLLGAIAVYAAARLAPEHNGHQGSVYDGLVPKSRLASR
jgi:hypothetical protein